jgi:hypothetical protein
MHIVHIYNIHTSTFIHTSYNVTSLLRKGSGLKFKVQYNEEKKINLPLVMNHVTLVTTAD